MPQFGDSEALRGRQGAATVAVLTIVQEELEAVKRVLGTTQNLIGTPYWVSKLSPDDVYGVIVRKSADRGNIPAEEAAGDIIEDFRPAFIVLVGIAGGFKDRDRTKLGDVILGDFIDYAESRKLQAGRDLPRRQPHDHPSLFLRTHVAEPRSSEVHWIKKIDANRPEGGGPKAIVGNIVAGEKLFADPANHYQRDILGQFDKALAVDMESMGFARAVFHARWSVHYNPQCLVIRGISDFVNDAGQDNDATRILWREYAANAAAAFAWAVIETIATLVKTGIQPKWVGARALASVISFLTGAKT